jgi:hypothetical protein
MKYENPNCSAFFFECGDFVNLEDVVYVHYSEDGTETTTGFTDAPTLVVFLRGAEEGFTRTGVALGDSDRRQLSDALRIYHSKL